MESSRKRKAFRIYIRSAFYCHFIPRFIISFTYMIKELKIQSKIGGLYMATFSEMMVEEFNDFLLERKLSIPNFEKADLDEDIPIYGKDRDYLKDRIDLVVFNTGDSIYGNDSPTINDFEATVIESFEDFLEENGIVIWNEEKYEALEDGMEAEAHRILVFFSDLYPNQEGSTKHLR